MLQLGSEGGIPFTTIRLRSFEFVGDRLNSGRSGLEQGLFYSLGGGFITGPSYVDQFNLNFNLFFIPNTPALSLCNNGILVLIVIRFWINKVARRGQPEHTAATPILGHLLPLSPSLPPLFVPPTTCR